MRAHQVILGVLAVVLLMGCGHRGPIWNPFAGGTRAVRLTVQNDDFNDAAIYANWQGGIRHRVGLSIGETTETFVFDWRGDFVVFQVQFTAGGHFAVEQIKVQEGDHLDLVLPIGSSTRGYLDLVP